MGRKCVNGWMHVGYHRIDRLLETNAGKSTLSITALHHFVDWFEGYGYITELPNNVGNYYEKLYEHHLVKPECID